MTTTPLTGTAVDWAKGVLARQPVPAGRAVVNTTTPARPMIDAPIWFDEGRDSLLIWNDNVHKGARIEYTRTERAEFEDGTIVVVSLQISQRLVLVPGGINAVDEPETLRVQIDRGDAGIGPAIESATLPTEDLQKMSSGDVTRWASVAAGASFDAAAVAAYLVATMLRVSEAATSPA